jgi:hypothetical protein
MEERGESYHTTTVRRSSTSGVFNRPSEGPGSRPARSATKAPPHAPVGALRTIAAGHVSPASAGHASDMIRVEESSGWTVLGKTVGRERILTPAFGGAVCCGGEPGKVDAGCFPPTRTVLRAHCAHSPVAAQPASHIES